MTLKKNAKSSTAKKSGGDNHEEAKVAIAMALFLFNSELHDKESFIITLKKSSQVYSPWNSKIYTLRQTPIRK